jgi:hypothetical protein
MDSWRDPVYSRRDPAGWPAIAGLVPQEDAL